MVIAIIETVFKKKKLIACVRVNKKNLSYSLIITMDD